jgi:hypothetical protein
VVNSWEAALRLIDRYPWHRLYPLTVHPEFCERGLSCRANPFRQRAKTGGSFNVGASYARLPCCDVSLSARGARAQSPASPAAGADWASVPALHPAGSKAAKAKVPARAISKRVHWQSSPLRCRSASCGDELALSSCSP